MLDRGVLVAELPRLLEPWVSGKIDGKSFASGAHIIGRQAQIMAVFSSIIVHIEEVRSSSERFVSV